MVISISEKGNVATNYWKGPGRTKRGVRGAAAPLRILYVSFERCFSLIEIVYGEDVKEGKAKGARYLSWSQIWAPLSIKMALFFDCFEQKCFFHAVLAQIAQ
jgi:hypothetical protein